MDQLVNLKDDEDIDVNTFKSTIGMTREDVIHVNNFPYAFNENDLRLLFKDCGEILKVSVPEDRALK